MIVSFGCRDSFMTCNNYGLQQNGFIRPALRSVIEVLPGLCMAFRVGICFFSQGVGWFWRLLPDSGSLATSWVSQVWKMRT